MDPTAPTPDERRAALAHLTAAHRDLQAALADLEQRIARAHEASTAAELDALVAAGPIGAPGGLPALVYPPPLDEARIAVLFQHADREGRWTMPRVLRIGAVCGHVELDLSEAVLLPGVSEIVFRTWMTHVELIVPAWIELVGDGSVAFTRRDGGPPPAAPPRATVRLTGRAWATNIQVRPAATRPGDRSAAPAVAVRPRP